MGKSQAGDEKDVKLGAGVFAAGTGTILVAIANILPEENTWKPWLIILSPSVSVIANILGLWLQQFIVSYIKNFEESRKLDDLVNTIDKYLSDSNLTSEFKDHLLRSKEQAQLTVINRKLNDLKQSSEYLTSNSVSSEVTELTDKI